MKFKDLFADKKRIYVSLAIFVSFTLGFGSALLSGISVFAHNNNTPIPGYNQQKVKKSQNKNGFLNSLDFSCPVKAKTRADGSMVYYLPDQLPFSRVKADKCFNSESEAISAGYVKSGSHN